MKTKEEIHSLIPKLIDEINERLIERDELSRLVVLAIFSQNHMFLIGERGVAKSMTVELINDVIEGTKFWQLQMGEDTTVEELFGEKRSDEDGAMQYVSKNSILHSHFVVLDEMFKARGEVLNALLELLVDGAYTSGDGNKRKSPLVSVFGTSNEFPTETKMLPYVDRFPIWFEVERIQKIENRVKYYAGDFNKEKIDKKYFSLDDLAFIKQEAKKIEIPMEIIELYQEITSVLVKQAVKTSDRKYERVLHNIMKAMAYLNNRDNINVSDVFILLHTSWHDSFEKDKVNRIVFEKIFGSKEELERIVLDCTQNINDIDSWKNANLYDFLHYRTEIEGNNKNEVFKNIADNVEIIWSKYNQNKEILERLIAKYNYNIEIEKQLEENLFISNYKQNSFFTKDLLGEIQKLLKILREKMFELEQWHSESNTIFNYQRIMNNKMAKSQ